MKVLVSGPTGLVGSALADYLTVGRTEIVHLTRSEPAPGVPTVRWDPAAGRLDATELEGLDAVVHLAGDNIAHGRWTAQKKERIRASRVDGTRLLCEALASCQQRPKTLVCASAIGYYGSRGDEVCTESTTPGEDFLAEVAKAWEEATAPAAEAGVRVVNLRIGVVLSPSGGLLARLLLPFKLCLGGRVGSGRQYMSWISLEDLIGVIEHALERRELVGPVNAVAPGALTNRDFAKALGRALHRPAWMPLPAWVVRLVFSEMGTALMLSSTRVSATKLAETGYEFRHADIDTALQDLVQAS
jgi:hypothetical protein